MTRPESDSKKEPSLASLSWLHDDMEDSETTRNEHLLIQETRTSNSSQAATVEWKRLQEQHFNIGYKQGLEAGEEQTLQPGFDRGYAIGAKFGMELGRLKGALRFPLEDGDKQTVTYRDQWIALQQLFQSLDISQLPPHIQAYLQHEMQDVEQRLN